MKKNLQRINIYLTEENFIHLDEIIDAMNAAYYVKAFNRSFLIRNLIENEYHKYQKEKRLSHEKLSDWS